jgi:hypothetical protein
MLQEFAESFGNTKQELEAIILHRTTLVTMQTSNVVNNIASEVSQLTKFMNAQTTREREAHNFIKLNGGVEAILKVLNQI